MCGICGNASTNVPSTRSASRGEEDLSRQLWGLLAFTLWHERHVEREPGPLREPRLEHVLAER